MRSRLLAVIAASGLALASNLVEARGPGGGQSAMGGGYGHAPAQVQGQNGNTSQMRTQDQERIRTQDHERNKSQAQEQGRVQDQQRTRTQDQERVRER